MVDDLWVDELRAQFLFTAEDTVNLAAMTVAGNPTPVREAIRTHRTALDRAPYQTQLDRLHTEEGEVCQAVSDYFGAPVNNIALASSTTLGLALLYAGIQIRPGQEILTTEHEFSKTLSMFDLRKARDGTPTRRLRLMPDPANVTVDSVLTALRAALCSHTRVLALQWVYSNTGVKLPIPQIARWLETDVNPGRAPQDRVFLCVDGVHGFGVEGTRFDALGCHFFVSGCHKWVFGPRGTAIWCATDDAWNQYNLIVPTSSNSEKLGLRHTVGGVQAYEHWWSLDEAFRLLIALQPERIARRVHQLATSFKEEIKSISGVRVITPMSEEYSAGIICFDIPGLTASEAVTKLVDKHRIRTSVSSSDAGRPPDLRHVRVSIGVFNTEEEIKRCVAAVALLAGQS